MKSISDLLDLDNLSPEQKDIMSEIMAMDELKDKCTSLIKSGGDRKAVEEEIRVVGLLLAHTNQSMKDLKNGGLLHIVMKMKVVDIVKWLREMYPEVAEMSEGKRKDDRPSVERIVASALDFRNAVVRLENVSMEHHDFKELKGMMEDAMDKAKITCEAMVLRKKSDFTEDFVRGTADLVVRLERATNAWEAKAKAERDELNHRNTSHGANESFKA